jgi:TonB family protein
MIGLEPAQSNRIYQRRAVAQQSASPSTSAAAPLLSWTLGITLATAIISIIGLRSPNLETIRLTASFTPEMHADLPHQELLELSAAPFPAAELSAETSSADEPAALPIFDLQTLTPPEPITIPDLAEPLSMEDLQEIADAPPVDALAEIFEPTPAPAPPKVTQPATTPRPSTTTNSVTSTSSSGGTGTGSTTSGGGKGYFPQPPYPSSARSRGIQGSVQLTIQFGADGRVTSATVSGSSGYSELDRYASDWVRRNWRNTPGQGGSYRQPIHFRLR